LLQQFGMSFVPCCALMNCRYLLRTSPAFSCEVCC